MKMMTKPEENNQQEPGLFTAATSLSEPTHSFVAAPRLLSIGIHVLLVSLALVPWTAGPVLRPKLNETTVVLYTPSDLVLKLPLDAARSDRSGGGGGGGKHELTKASLGQLPRAADKQLAPPDPKPSKNPDPELIVEPTIVAPQLAQLHPVTLLNIGDPNGVVGPPSSGTGDRGGIGNDGRSHGVGDNDGPGAGPGKDGGYGGDAFSVGGDVSAPTIVYRVEPEYSEEARKVRYQGTVLLAAIVKRDGTVDVTRVIRMLGFGLDQNAIQALKQWRFRPAMKDGMPVDVTLNIEVRFNLR
jgi:protein TonB